MEYPDKPATLDTQDIELRQKPLGTQDTGLRQITIGHTRHRTATNNHWAHKTQDKNKKTGAKPGTREVLALKRNKILDIIKKPEINVGT